MSKIEILVNNQKKYFETNSTKSVSFRKAQLKHLYNEIKRNETEILVALKNDLNKSEFEAYETELGLVYEELKFMIKNIDKLTKPKKKKTPIMHFPSKSYTYKDAYGCVLIMSPWNYPFQLTMVPLIGAIAAGNCVLIKTSEYSKSTSQIISKICESFNKEYICVVQGGRDVNQEVLNQKFDYIFFTGGPTVGRIVMEKASQYLTPITLELGGKSPCIVDKSANIDLSAKRIIWGKLLNSGQTCVAPDYILVHESVKEELLKSMKKYIKLFYGERPHENKEYPKIINEHHFNRLCDLIEKSNYTYGGRQNHSTLQIEPTIIENCSWNDSIMEDEIFGPIIPIIAYKDINEIVININKRPKPLALYCFTTCKEVENIILRNISFGGGCINDTIVHLSNSYLPFGGVGDSGMGSYHGIESFNTFSHTKSILKKSILIDVNIRYAPYKDKIKLLKKFM